MVHEGVEEATLLVSVRGQLKIGLKLSLKPTWM